MAVELTSAQRALLRGQARRMPSAVRVGRAGLTDSVLEHIDAELARHELVKVRLPQTADRVAAADRMSRGLDATVIDRIGHVIVLYRPSEHPPGGKSQTSKPK